MASTNYSPVPEAVYDDGSTYGSLIDDSHNFSIESDNIGQYVEIGARVEDDELDFDEIKIYMTYWDGTLSYYTDDLLNTSSIRSGHEANSVKYEDRNNVGDHTNNDDDNGHLSSSVGIYPKSFSKTGDYHVVFFRWYLNETILPNLTEDILIDIDLYDWDYNNTAVNSIPIVTCIDCNPPSNAPGIPTLLSADYNSTSSTVQLTFQADEANAWPNYFKIYLTWYNV